MSINTETQVQAITESNPTKKAGPTLIITYEVTEDNLEKFFKVNTPDRAHLSQEDKLYEAWKAFGEERGFDSRILKKSM